MYSYRLLGYPNTRIAYEAPADGGGGAGGGKFEWPAEVLAGFKKLLAREGGETDAAMKLYDENYEYRKEIRELKKRIEDAHSLSDEDLKSFGEFKKIMSEAGAETVQELKARLDQSSQAQKELEGLKREKAITQIAEQLGWNPKVLAKLGSDYEYQIRTRKDAEGKDQSYVVAIKDGEESEVSEDFAKQNFGAEFLPSLLITAEAGASDTIEGKPFPSQSSSNGSESGDGEGILESFLASNRKARGLDVK